jgi:hypothetical protein
MCFRFSTWVLTQLLTQLPPNGREHPGRIFRSVPRHMTDFLILIIGNHSEPQWFNGTFSFVKLIICRYVVPLFQMRTVKLLL